MYEDHDYKVLKDLQEINDLYRNSIAQDFLEIMDKDSTYIFGEGEEIEAILDKIELKRPIKGLSIVKNGKIIASNLKLKDLEKLTLDDNLKLVICPKNDGTIFQEFSRMLNHIKKENISILATPLRLERMRGRALIVKTDDEELNVLLSGFYKVITSYRRKAIYSITASK